MSLVVEKKHSKAKSSYKLECIMREKQQMCACLEFKKKGKLLVGVTSRSAPDFIHVVIL